MFHPALLAIPTTPKFPLFSHSLSASFFSYLYTISTGWNTFPTFQSPFNIQFKYQYFCEFSPLCLVFFQFPMVLHTEHFPVHVEVGAYDFGLLSVKRQNMEGRYNTESSFGFYRVITSRLALSPRCCFFGRLGGLVFKMFFGLFKSQHP